MYGEESTGLSTHVEPAHGDADVEEDEPEQAHDDREERDHCMGHLQDLSFGGFGVEVPLETSRWCCSTRIQH